MEFIDKGLGFRVKGLRFIVKGLRFIAKGLEFIVKGFRFIVKGFRSTVPGHNIIRRWFWPLGFRVITSTNVVRYGESLACIYVV